MSDNKVNEGIIQSGGSINADQIAIGKFAKISGTINKSIADLNSSQDFELLQLANLLKNLKESIEGDDILSPSDKVDALEQVEKITRAEVNSNGSSGKKIVKKASRTLKGIAAELPSATKFIEACNKFLPIITKIFGI